MNDPGHKPAPSKKVAQPIPDTVTETIDFIRAKLMSFELLSQDDERNLAQKLAEASRAIALLTIGWEESAQELVCLANSAISNRFRKELFSSREYYFALRREMDELVNTHGNKDVLTLLVDALSSHQLSHLNNYIATVDWPGALMIALAKRHAGTGSALSTLELAIDEYLSNVMLGSRSDRQPCEQHQAQLNRYINDYLNSRETLVNHNLRLVFHIAKRYTQRTDELIELIQEGACGLIRAAEKFRPATGYRFSTYAHQWIESKIRKARVNIDKVIPISLDYNNDLMRLSQRKQQRKSTDSFISLYELSKELNINKERFYAIMRLKRYGLSLDEKSADERHSLHAKLADPDSNFIDSVSNESYVGYLNAVMQTNLTERESYIINERFGRLGRDPKTLNEISDILGISRERVRQLEIGALEKLQACMNDQQPF